MMLDTRDPGGDSGILTALHGRAAEAAEEAEAAIVALVDSAKSADMETIAEALQETAESLREPMFTIAVIGRFNSGKSTLLNALMAGVTHPVRLNGAQGPLPVGRYPTTAILTRIVHSPEPYVVAYQHDGSRVSWTLDQYLDAAKLDPTLMEKGNQERLGHIREFEFGYPSRLGDGGVVLYDSPGTDDNPRRDAYSRDATRRSEAAIALFNSQTPLSDTEVTAVMQAIHEKVTVFAVMNLFHDDVADETMRAYCWNRYVRTYTDASAPPWDGTQDLARQRFYFVNARAAQRGRHTGDVELVRSSGLAEFEAALGRFLEQEKHAAHVGRFIAQADGYAVQIEGTINDLVRAAEMDRDVLRDNYERTLPQLAELRRKAQRLGQLIDKAQAVAKARAVASFHDNEDALTADLPEAVSTIELTFGEKLKGAVSAKSVKERFDHAINAYVAERRNDWAERTLKVGVDKIFSELMAEIAEDVAKLERDLQSLEFTLTGRPLTGSLDGASTGLAKRLMIAAGALMVGDVPSAVLGGAAGWKATAAGLGGAVAAGIALVAVGASAPVAIPAIVLVQVLTGGLVGARLVEQRLKAAAVKAAADELQQDRRNLIQLLESDVDNTFTAFRTVVVREVDRTFDEQERKIQHQLAISQQDEASKAEELRRLDLALVSAQAHRRQLAEAANKAAQHVAMPVAGAGH